MGDINNGRAYDMNHFLLRSCLLIVFFSSLTMTVAADKPNVLFMMSDDLNTRSADTDIRNAKRRILDALAKSGVSFTQAFCQFPLCGPSRLPS